jgi:hypothetical protein
MIEPAKPGAAPSKVPKTGNKIGKISIINFRFSGFIYFLLHLFVVLSKVISPLPLGLPARSRFGEGRGEGQGEG